MDDGRSVAMEVGQASCHISQEGHSETESDVGCVLQQDLQQRSEWTHSLFIVPA